MKNEFIKEMIELVDEVSTGDLQGMVEVFCMQNGENEEEILNSIYEGADAQ